MSNFVSGIFKKCKYGGYFIVYLIAFINLIGFGYCLTPDYTYSSVQNFSSITNEYPNSDTFLCFNASDIMNYSFNEFAIRDNNYNDFFTVNGNGFRFIGGFHCVLIPSGTSNFFISRNEPTWQLQSIYFYQFLLGGAIPTCENSACNLTVYDTFTSQSSIYKYELSAGNSQDIRFSYDSSVSSYQVYGTNSNPNYSFSPSSSLINCGNSLSSCQASLSTLSGNYNTLSGNYNTCLNDLSTCQNNSSNCSSCESDLSTCQSNLSSCGTSLNSCNSDLTACLSGNVGTGDYNWSAIFINNIQHIGKPIINITIPEEIARDYTGTENSFDLKIDGYGYDEEKMLNMIDIQNYKPTGEEMSNLISKFADFVPLLGICLLFIAIRYIAKRIFKG